MKTLFRLLTLYMTVPIVELFFLYQVNRLFGYWTGGYGWILTGLLIVTTAVTGSYLAKREGLSAWDRLQGSFSGGGLPGDEILDAVIILIAGVLLITPGVLTDFVGFVGLIPLTRGWIRRVAKKRIKKAIREGRLQATFGAFDGADPDGGMGYEMDHGASYGAGYGTNGPTVDETEKDEAGRGRFGAAGEANAPAGAATPPEEATPETPSSVGGTPAPSDEPPAGSEASDAPDSDPSLPRRTSSPREDEPRSESAS